MSIFSRTPKENLSLKEFEEIFRTLYPSVRNFLYFKTADMPLSEDIAQDVFFKLWETRNTVKKITVKSYLYTIANNLAINHFKREKLKFRFASLEYSGTENKTPEYLMEMQEFDEKLQNVLGELSAGSREVFLMNRVEGLTYNDISERLNISVKAVEKRMSKALEILREKIDFKI